ncbi:MAG: hypothetical protein MK135_07100 [Polyangiaceae bacterium]|nr:hypothetical protein [Polyangiaceae bacterium]
MQLPRFIPRKVFQTIAVMVITGGLVLTVYETATASGLYSLIHDILFEHELRATLAFVLTFGTYTTFSCFALLPLRRFSKMPSFKAQFSLEGVSIKEQGLLGASSAAAVKVKAARKATRSSGHPIHQVGLFLFLFAVVIPTLLMVDVTPLLDSTDPDLQDLLLLTSSLGGATGGLLFSWGRFSEVIGIICGCVAALGGMLVSIWWLQERSEVWAFEFLLTISVGSAPSALVFVAWNRLFPKNRKKAAT